MTELSKKIFGHTDEVIVRVVNSINITFTGRNVLQLFNIRETRNFTCVAASKLGMIETQSTVKVQGKFLK